VQAAYESTAGGGRRAAATAELKRLQTELEGVEQAVWTIQSEIDRGEDINRAEPAVMARLAHERVGLPDAHRALQARKQEVEGRVRLAYEAVRRLEVQADNLEVGIANAVWQATSADAYRAQEIKRLRAQLAALELGQAQELELARRSLAELELVAGAERAARVRRHHNL